MIILKGGIRKMKYRKKLSKRTSRNVFRKAIGVNPKNELRPIKRGGIRM
jgi:hypothetical protein